MAHPTSPTLYTYHCVPTVQNAQLDGVHDAKLQAAVDIFLPRCVLEVWLWLVEQDRVDPTVEM